MRRSAIVAIVCGTSLLAAAAKAAPDWRPIPGAPELAVDIGSLQPQGALVKAWIRMAGSGRQLGALRPEPQGLRPSSVHRLVVHAQVDCRLRTIRMLEAQGYLGSGAAAFMSSVPSAFMPLPPDEGVGWAYDAVCEMARTRFDAR